MATQKEYVEAAIKRIRDWCKSANCEIPDIAYVSISALDMVYGKLKMV